MNLSPDLTTIIAKRNVLKGYKYNACVQCSNALQTVTSVPFAVTQAAIDCNDKIHPKMKEKLELSYSKTAKKAISAASFFNLDDAKHCPIIDCKLYETGCKSGFSDGKERIVIGDKNPWNVVVKSNQLRGYIKKVCV